MKVRAKIAPLLDNLGVIDRAAGLTKHLGGGKLTILMYHRVAVPGAQPLLDDRVISATLDEFEEQMTWLAKFANPIGFRQLLQLEKMGAAIPPRTVIVTFDDGYLDNYLCAFPVLTRHRIPATVFLVTGLVGTKEPSWWDLVHGALRREKKTTGEVAQEIERLKRLPDWDRRKAVENFVRRTGLSVSDFSRTIINWDEAREMRDEGIDFGGHTVTHPILSKLGLAALKAEIRECKADIERELHREVISFAYPVGRDFALTEQLFESVEEEGYYYAVTTEYGPNRRIDENRYRLRRIGVSLDDSLGRFKAKYLFPTFFRSR